MEINNELRLAWEFIEHTDRSIFLTGKAGTGKTTFLKAVREYSTKRMIVVAPTGVAAINADGVTIHSFFQIPPGVFVPETQVKQRFDYSQEKRNIMRTLDLLVIDEISMVRSDLLDAIDMVLRRFRDHSKPFGGVQLLMIGDLQQLTPVVTAEEEEVMQTHYSTPYFFGSHALTQIAYVTIELSHVYRQQDETFISILNNIREGHATTADLQMLNSRYNPYFHPDANDGYIRLTTHNRLADNYNSRELLALTGASHTYTAEIDGEFPNYLEPTATTLELKVGAQVMFVKNDPNQRYYNGKIGHITHLYDESIFVLCPGEDKEIELKPDVWENTRYTINDNTKMIEPEVVGTFKQFPLRLAWAITIHKSQGLTFEHAIIDAQLSFASGQVYVALSRCKTLEGMVLASPIAGGAIMRDNSVDTYISQQQETTRTSIANLPLIKQQYEKSLLMELFSFWELKKNEEALHRTLAEHFMAFPKTIQLHKITCDKINKELLPTATKWLTLIQGMSYEATHDAAFLERVKRSATYFQSELSKIFDTVITATHGVTSNNKTAIKRLDNSFTALQQTYKAKRLLLEDIAHEGFTAGSYLQFKQNAYLIAVDGKGKKKKKNNGKKSPFAPTAATPKVSKEPKEPKVSSAEISFKMFREGKKLVEIAEERGFVRSTIFTHLSEYVVKGELELEALVPKAHQQIIRNVMKETEVTGTKDIKEKCPDYISWDEIRLVTRLEE